MSDLILDTKSIDAKLKRLAYEIYENNYKEKTICLIGMNTQGNILADLLQKELESISEIQISRGQLNINPANPTKEIELNIDINSLKDKVAIIIDDVANTGRSLFYACKPLMEVVPKKIEFAVLVDRKHKMFPVKVDYVGLSLATTLKENILVKLSGKKKEAFFS